MLLWTSRSLQSTKETVILVSKFLFRIRILFAAPILLLVHRSVVFKIFLLIFLFVMSSMKKDLKSTNVNFEIVKYDVDDCLMNIF